MFNRATAHKQFKTMENLHENTGANPEKEALRKISHEFHELVTHNDPANLHSAAWGLFQSFLLANANSPLPDDIYTYSLIYECLRNICQEIEKVSRVCGNRFKITYEPVSASS